MKKKKQAILDIKAKMESMDYDQWVEAMEKANRSVLKEFEKSLIDQSLSDKTIRKHVDNIDLFVNMYQTSYSYCGTMFDGWNDFDDFIGYWFVRKCLWSSVSAIRGLVASLRKFYLFLAKTNYVTEEERAQANLILDDGMEKWIDELHEFDDFAGDID